MIKLQLETFKLQIMGVVILLLQNVPILNYFSSAFVMVLIIYFYIKNKLEYSMFFLMLFSVFTVGINFYTFKIVGINLYYLTMIFLLVYILVKQSTNTKLPIQHTKISHITFCYLTILMFVLINSIDNMFYSIVYFAKDLNILLLIPLVTYVLFKNIDIKRFIYIIYNIISIKIITALIMYLSGYTIYRNENLFGALSIDNTDELNTLYFLLLITIVLFGRKISNIWLNMIFLILIAGTYFYGLNFSNIGSQSILMLGIVLIVLAFKNKYIIAWLALISFFAYSSSDLTNINNEYLSYKLNNIYDAFSNLDMDSIYLIPHSPQVRIIELINILSHPWYNILFGHGLGGYFTDSYFSFNAYIGQYDFTEYEINSRSFYNPHNLGYSFLKFGLLWLLFILYLMYKSRHIIDLEIKIFVYISLFTLMLNIGYGIKTSILLGIVLILISHSQKKIVNYEKN